MIGQHLGVAFQEEYLNRKARGGGQGRSQPHSPGWARVPLSSFFPQISINFSSNFTYFLPHFGPPVRGVLKFVLDRGVPLEPQNPYPSLRVILAKKVHIFKDYPSKIGLFFKNSAIFGPENHVIWGSVRKVDPCLRIFWVKNGTHV